VPSWSFSWPSSGCSRGSTQDLYWAGDFILSFEAIVGS